MTSRLEQLFDRRTVLCDGAMGTSLYARGVFINRCYDELNLSQPDLVRSVHEEYLQAGAEIIETNTFGANPLRLQRYGLRDRSAEINQAGVRIARQAVRQLADKQAGTAWSRVPSGLSACIWSRSARPASTRRAMLSPNRFVPWSPAVPASASTCSSSKPCPRSMKPNRQCWPRASLRPIVPVVVMVTVDEEANCLDGASAGNSRHPHRVVGRRCAGLQLQRRSSHRIDGHRTHGRGHRPAADGDAECGHAPLHRRPEHLSLLAGIHGEFRAQIHQGRRAICRRMLRNNSAAHQGHEVGAAGHRTRRPPPRQRTRRSRS